MRDRKHPPATGSQTTRVSYYLICLSNAKHIPFSDFIHARKNIRLIYLGEWVRARALGSFVRFLFKCHSLLSECDFCNIHLNALASLSLSVCTVLINIIILNVAKASLCSAIKHTSTDTKRMCSVAERRNYFSTLTLLAILSIEKCSSSHQHHDF